MPERDDPPISDVHANPQDTAFGKAAADDQERIERGERGDEPVHDEADKPRPGGKADPA
jgi:hypothetical protein